MPSSALHALALMVATGTLYLVADGVLAQGAVLPESHRLMGTGLLVLSMVQAVWVFKVESRWLPRMLGGALVAGFALLAFLSGNPAVHATVSQLAFGVAASLAGLTSAAWQRGPRVVADEGSPSVRTLGWLAPVSVAVQAALGAGLRHEVLPVWLHISGSLLVGGLLLFAGMAVMQSYSMHDALRGAGLTLLWITSLQVTLGMAAYGVRMMAHPAPSWAIWLTVGHVTTGALTMAAAMMFAFQVFYHVRENLLVHEAAA